MIVSSSTSLSPLPFPSSSVSISILSYNILLPNSLPSKVDQKQGGWWVYKMYSPRHHLNESNHSNIDITSWNYRSRLIQEDLKQSNCDIVCYQEVYPETYELDFQFMAELGYDSSVIYRKGEFRPAIFWKSSKVTPISEPIHRDRCLIIPFEIVSLSSSSSTSSGFQHPFYVCNCHLQAGVNNSERRFRQISDSLDTIRKHAMKSISSHIDLLKKKSQQMKKRKPRKERTAPPGETTDADIDHPQQQQQQQQSEINYVDLAESLLSSTPIVLLGDMNCDPVDECGSHSLLIYGEATVEGKVSHDKEQNEQKFSDDNNKKENSVKCHPFLPFLDTYDYAYRGGGGRGERGIQMEPPPTMIVEELYDVLTIPLPDQLSDPPPYQDSLLLTPLAQYNLQLSPLATDRLRLMFEKYAQTFLPLPGSSSNSDKKVMSSGDIKRWLVDINKEWNRGSEYRAAMIRMKFFSSPASSKKTSSSFPRPPSPPPSSLPGESPRVQEEEHPSVPSPSVSIPDNGYLDWPEYRSIYEQMIAEGKVWAVSSDMATCGFQLPDSSRVFTARYDRIYISGALQDCLVHVRDIPCGSIEEGCRGVGGCLPNALYPSDHLPVAIALSLPNSFDSSA
jgi:hypothetical protein